MALAASTQRNMRDRNTQPFVVDSGVQVYSGSYVCINKATGELVLAADTVNFEWAGVATQTVLGDGTLECTVDISGKTLARVAVTGVTGLANVGDLVYVTDDDTLTLTATTNIQAVGVVVRWHSSTTCDVALFAMHEHRCTPVA